MRKIFTKNDLPEEIKRKHARRDIMDKIESKKEKILRRLAISELKAVKEISRDEAVLVGMETIWDES